MNHALPARAGSFPRRRPLAAALLLAGAVSAATASQAAETGRDLWRDGAARPAPGPIRPAPAGDPGGLTRHDDLASFEAATATMDLQFEDFEGGFGDITSGVDCFQALGRDSNDACFAPGDLVPGFAMRSSRGSIFGEAGDSDLVKLGPWVTGTPSTVVGAYQPVGATHISFEPDVVAVAMNVFDVLQGQTVAVTAYAAGDVQIGTLTVSTPAIAQAAFLGLTSDTPIDRIELDALAEGGAEMIDDLYFGGRAGVLELAIPVASPERGAGGVTRIELEPAAVGATAITSVPFRNAGHLPLAISALPPLSAPLSWTGGTCTGTALAPGATCTAQIAFAPTHEGRFDSVIADATVLAQSLTVTAEAQVDHVTPVPGHLEFGIVASGGQSTPQTITLRNFTALEASAVALTTSGPFVAAGGTCGAAPFELPPGAGCTLIYRFAPTSDGDFAGRVEIEMEGGARVRAGLTGRTGTP